jgi:hypothetical protein
MVTLVFCKWFPSIVILLLIINQFNIFHAKFIYRLRNHKDEIKARPLTGFYKSRQKAGGLSEPVQ